MTIKNNAEFAEQYSDNLNIKIQELGIGEIEEVSESNIIGVIDNLNAYNDTIDMLNCYKIQLETDLKNIRDVGIEFFNVDHNLMKI